MQQCSNQHREAVIYTVLVQVTGREDTKATVDTEGTVEVNYQ